MLFMDAGYGKFGTQDVRIMLSGVISFRRMAGGTYGHQDGDPTDTD